MLLTGRGGGVQATKKKPLPMPLGLGVARTAGEGRVVTRLHVDEHFGPIRRLRADSKFFFSFRVRVAWSSRPPCSVVAGYACSHPFMVFNRVVSLLAVGLVVVGSLENSWLVGVFRLSCVWIEVHSSSTCCWVSSFRPPPPPCILCLYTYFCSWS